MMNTAPVAARAAGDETPPEVPGIAGEREPRQLGLWSVCGLALVVGVTTGFGAVFFRALIGVIHNLAFLGHPSLAYDSSLFTPRSPWGVLVILVPVIGSLGVTFIVNAFAPEAKGHGVPEVMDAIYYKRGVIRPVVAAAKSAASALAIGTGAAVGREGPIIQIGSALSSTRMRRSNKRFWRSGFGRAGVSRAAARAAGSLVHSYPAERAVPDQDASFKANRLGGRDPSLATAINPVELRSHATPARPTRRKSACRTHLVC
jgi:hypothetical protein